MAKKFYTLGQRLSGGWRSASSGPWWRSKLTYWVAGGVVVVGLLVWTALVLANHKNPTDSVIGPGSSQTEGDKNGPKISVATPDISQTYAVGDTLVTGTVDEGSTVTINDVAALVKGTGYNLNVKLVAGENTLRIVATKDGKTTTKTIKVTAKAAAAPVPQITLTAAHPGIGGDVQLNWIATNLDPSNGYYILRAASKDAITDETARVNKVAGSINTYTQYIPSSSTPLDGGTYYYAVCVLKTDNGDCQTVSNIVTILNQIKTYVTQINITGNTGTTVNFNYNKQAPGGYLLLWSTDASPAYKGTGVYTHYTPNPIPDSLTMDNNATSGQTYHVRVCEYLGDACGTYSNEVTITLP